MKNSLHLVFALCVFCAFSFALSGFAAEEKEPDPFSENIKPLFEKYCVGCHGVDSPTGIDLKTPASEADFLAKPDILTKMHTVVSKRTMPPKGMPQLSRRERKLLSEWSKDNAAKAKKAAEEKPSEK
jgi:mono/diheme cytochrome c family protein